MIEQWVLWMVVTAFALIVINVALMKLLLMKLNRPEKKVYEWIDGTLRNIPMPGDGTVTYIVRTEGGGGGGGGGVGSAGGGSAKGINGHVARGKR